MVLMLVECFQRAFEVRTASLQPRRLIRIVRLYHVNNLTQLLKLVSIALFGLLDCLISCKFSVIQF